MQPNKISYFDLSTLFFKTAALISAILIIGFIGFIFYTAFPALSKSGIDFVITNNYGQNGTYGFFNYIVGTIALTILTMLMACPVSILTAIFLAEDVLN